MKDEKDRDGNRGLSSKRARSSDVSAIIRRMTHCVNSQNARGCEMISIPIRINERVVGEVRGETFYKNLIASKHFLRVPRAIAFDVSSLDDAERAGARFVQVTDIETERVFRQSIATIRAKGFRVARGYGEQIALALEFWNLDCDPLARQLNLFELECAA